jgi:hypothetical protein
VINTPFHVPNRASAWRIAGTEQEICGVAFTTGQRRVFPQVILLRAGQWSGLTKINVEGACQMESQFVNHLALSVFGNDLRGRSS